MREYLARLFDHAAWADRRTLESLRDTPAAHAEALPLLAHLLAAEHVWLARVEGRAPRHAVWPTLGLEECEALATENAAGYRALLDGRGERLLSESVRYRTTAGQDFATPVLDILTQVVTHGPYHRGQIAKIIGRHGGTAANTDFITFARDAAPAEGR